jgi:hypothetical protein
LPNNDGSHSTRWAHNLWKAINLMLICPEKMMNTFNSKLQL